MQRLCENQRIYNSLIAPAIADEATLKIHLKSSVSPNYNSMYILCVKSQWQQLKRVTKRPLTWLQIRPQIWKNHWWDVEGLSFRSIPWEVYGKQRKYQALPIQRLYGDISMSAEVAVLLMIKPISLLVWVIRLPTSSTCFPLNKRCFYCESKPINTDTYSVAGCQPYQF